MNQTGDRHEREAERAADAVIAGRTPSFNFSRLALHKAHREDKPSMPEKPERLEGETFLQTAPGREIREKANDQGEFISTLPGKVITGAAISDALGGLDVTEKALLTKLPEIPLDKIKPGLKAKEGPVNEPEKHREEAIKLQKELYEFRHAMKTPEERAAEERAMYAQIAARLGVKGEPSPASFEAAGIRMGVPAAGVVPRKAPRESDPGDAPPIVPSVLASSGQPLDASTRVSMETRFGFDFSKVRIHTDVAAAESARAMDAVAYTVGSDIVFGGGTFSPNTAPCEHLLAHELAHIVQQEGLPEVDHSLTSRPAIQLKKKKDAGTEPDPLQKAMKGDDDDVRDLTNHPSWSRMRVNAEQAAQLIVKLLEGATYDEDEEAGLKILRRMLVNNELDRTLEDLAEMDRLDQLFDDYDGPQYRQLLKLISGGIENWKVKALVLDVFVAMWWLNTAEERAVVVILENTDDLNDRLDLLTDKNRLDEFRSDIDDHDLWLRFEEAVGEAIGERWDKLSVKLTSIFTIAGTKSVKRGKRTQEEVDHLFEEAVKDLADELVDYKKRIREAIDEDDPGKLADINKEFRLRLDKLVADKGAEYGLELKYNIEFNRLLDVTFGRKWFQEDLKEIDEILAKMPYDILHLNTELEEFARSKINPKEDIAGLAESDEGRIQLRGKLRLKTTAHEIGHFIHFSDDKLFKEFRALSEWRYVARRELPNLINNAEDRERLEKKLDQDYQKGEEDKFYHGDDFEVGDYVYRYSRYQGAGHYLRRSKKAKFITTYASTDPDDDFADSFAFMFSNPAELKNEIPAKYEFMLVRVLTDYRLNQQKSKVLKRFDEMFKDKTMHGIDMAREVRDKYVTPLRKTLEAALDRQRGAQVAMTRARVKANPRPIPMGAQAETLAEPYLQQARRLATLTVSVIARYNVFAGELARMNIMEIEPGVQDAFDHLSENLEIKVREDLIKELDPLAIQALKGEEIEKPEWPEMDAIVKKALESVGVIRPYLPRYADSLVQGKILTLKSSNILKRLPKNARRERIQIKLNDLDSAFAKDLSKWREHVLDLIRAGKPFDKWRVKRPLDMRVAYEAKVNRVVRETR